MRILSDEELEELIKPMIMIDPSVIAKAQDKRTYQQDLKDFIELVDSLKFHYNVSMAFEKAKGFVICQEKIIRILKQLVEE